MKHIVIHQENAPSFTVEDNDESTLEEFSKSLANILESNNVSILHTSTSSVIVRPNKITSIVVYEVHPPEQRMSEPPKPEEMQQVEVKEEKIEEQEDIITD